MDSKKAIVGAIIQAQLLLLFAFILSGCSADPHNDDPKEQRQAVESAFTIPEPDLVPEGIAHDPASGAFFVGSTYKRKVVKIAKDGTISTFAGGDGDMLGPVGMRVDEARNLLWVNHAAIGDDAPIIDGGSYPYGLSGIAAFDLNSGDRVYDFFLPVEGEGHFLNDLDIASDGILFISDTLGRKIYRLDPDQGEFAVIAEMPDGIYPNGVTLNHDQNALYIARAGVPGVYRLELETATLIEVEQSADGPLRGDGLYFDDGALIAVQPWIEDCHVCRFELDASGTNIVERIPLAGAHSAFLQPSTGVIAGDFIYVIANSQLQHFRKLFLEYGENYPLDQLKDVVILRVAL